MLSGIGPAKQLEKYGIPVIRDLQGVGANLIDHPVVDVYLKDKLDASARILRPNSVVSTIQFIKALILYQLTGKGMLAHTVRNFIALQRMHFHAFSSWAIPLRLFDRTTRCYFQLANFRRSLGIAHRVQQAQISNSSVILSHIKCVQMTTTL